LASHRPIKCRAPVEQVPLNACFAAVTALRDDGLVQLVGPAVGRLFAASGVGDMGVGELLWCLCGLHNMLARDLRLLSDNAGAKTPAMHARCVDFARVAVVAAPELPASYALGAATAMVRGAGLKVERKARALSQKLHSRQLVKQLSS